MFKLFGLGYLVYEVGELLRELTEFKMPQFSKEQSLKHRALLMSDLDGKVIIWIIDTFFPNSRLGKANLQLI